MNVLLVGSGGREHAMADALLRSPKLSSLFVAPGNTGTASMNVELDVDDHEAVVMWCAANGVDLVVVGPEAPLVAGLANALSNAGVAVFGPSAEAAQLEGSKAFARDFAARNGIPGPRSRAFSASADAIAWLDEIGGAAVVKADGLAAGKGVVVADSRPETEAAIRRMLDEGSMGSAGSRILLEERLHGEELSLFGICDGRTVVTLATAQDHKRVGTGDTGLNTGGMGAFAPVPGIDAKQLAELSEVFLGRAVTGMASEGTPYVGVLYAGVMLTDAGPRLIEYNCRFGDPEAQVVLPLLETDLLELFASAVDGTLGEIDVNMSEDTAATVVVCADGYPTEPTLGVTVPDVELMAGVTIVHAGMTSTPDGRLVSAGGRVASVTGRGVDLDEALERAYSVVDQLTGSGLFSRPDIGWRHSRRGALNDMSADASGDFTGPAGGAYAASGVSFEAGVAAIDRISESVKSTHDERVVSGLGSFGGVFDLAAAKTMDMPLMVASTDGVGTKTVLAEATGRWSGTGADIVNHGINDVLVQGARPVFFLDTVAAAQLDPDIVGQIVDGMAEACRAAGCVLLGGETAEMPGVLTDGSVDVSGTMVGLVERRDLLPRGDIGPGHVLVGLASSGLHTNGYSLARRAIAEVELDDQVPGGFGESFADALLATHRSYLDVLGPVLDAGLVDALAHITGGGLVDNLPRVLPDTVAAEVDTSSWPRPAIFDFLIGWAGLDIVEAHQILNCGIGMVCVVRPDDVEEFCDLIAEPNWIIGVLVESDPDLSRVRLR